jgi:hypothetical protein
MTLAHLNIAASVAVDPVIPYARHVKTPYVGSARIGDLHADIEIGNVDALRWTGTATNVHGTVRAADDATVTLLEQPRPGWSAHASATTDADGVVHLHGNTYFYGPKPGPLAPAERSLWIRKVPPAT